MRLKNLSKNGTLFLSVAIFGLLIGLSIQFVRAGWTAPASLAPGDNISAPILTNPISPQAINGTLTVKNLVVENGGTITLGTKAKSSWPVVYTPGTENITSSKIFTVPDGVNKLHVEAWGGGGGGAAGRVTGVAGNSVYVTAGGTGGSGGYAYFDFPVVAGQRLFINVGGGGYGAFRHPDFTDNGFRYVGGIGGSTTIYDYDTFYAYAQVFGGEPGWDIDRYSGPYSWCEGVRVAGGVATSPIAGAVLRNGNSGNPCTFTYTTAGGCGCDGDCGICWSPATIDPSGNSAPSAVGSSLVPSTGAFGRGGNGMGGGAYTDGIAVSPFGAARGGDGEAGRVIITW